LITHYTAMTILLLHIPCQLVFITTSIKTALSCFSCYRCNVSVVLPFCIKNCKHITM